MIIIYYNYIANPRCRCCLLLYATRIFLLYFFLFEQFSQTGIHPLKLYIRLWIMIILYVYILYKTMQYINNCMNIFILCTSSAMSWSIYDFFFFGLNYQIVIKINDLRVIYIIVYIYTVYLRPTCSICLYRCRDLLDLLSRIWQKIKLRSHARFLVINQSIA